MHVCIAIINEVRLIVETIIAIIQWIVETVCGWVTSTIRTVREVCEEVCGWLGPFSFLCDWVCKIIEVIETITEWICEKILVGIVIGFIRVVFEYVFYILTWVCWIIDWIPRAIDLLLCHLGFENQRHIHLCLKILTENRTSMTWTLDEVETLVAETRERLAQCNIHICVLDTEIIETKEHRTGLACGFGSLFTADHHWFRRHECVTSTFIPVTVFFVEELKSGKGCSIPGANYVLADRGASHATIAHEIGHLADLWKHHSDPNNVMFAPTSDDSTQLTKHQCCMIRTSKYVTTAQHILCRTREPILRSFATIFSRSHIKKEA